MKYCKICIQPDTRPHIEFTNEGICFACEHQKNIDHEIDWKSREEEIKKIAKWAKNNSEGTYDCVIGVSGGKDSTFQAIYARDVLGLNCLLVNLAPDAITKWGKQNIENLIQKGFDVIKIRPNPLVWKKTIKYAFEKYGNPVKPTEYPLWASSYRIALNFKIPLIIQGENAGLTLGVTKGVGKGDNALVVNQLDTMAGGNASDWVMDGITKEDLYWYQFPKKEEFENANIRAIWLNYYSKEWSFSHNVEFSLKQGFRGRENHDPNLTGRLSEHGSIDAESHQIVNQMIKYLKFGFGYITDEVCYLIREGKMTRQEGIELVNKYDGNCGPQYLKEFCDYLEITEKEFWSIADKFVNKDLFEKDNSGKWIPKFKVGIDFKI